MAVFIQSAAQELKKTNNVARVRTKNATVLLFKPDPQSAVDLAIKCGCWLFCIFFF